MIDERKVEMAAILLKGWAEEKKKASKLKKSSREKNKM